MIRRSSFGAPGQTLVAQLFAAVPLPILLAFCAARNAAAESPSESGDVGESRYMLNEPYG
jgi:hypothetical protein